MPEIEQPVAKPCAACQRGDHTSDCGGPESGCGCAARNHYRFSAPPPLPTPSPEEVHNGATIVRLAHEVAEEVLRAQGIHKPMNSLHEGWAVLKEEEEELWELIKMNRTKMSNLELQLHQKKLRAEAIQVAAMAIRLVKDVIDR